MARAQNAQPYLSLDRYRQLMNIPRCMFNGVEGSGETVTGCDHCWLQWEREMIAMALYDAEQMLATHLRYYLGPHFLVDYDHEWTDPLQLEWGHIIGAGIEGLTDVTADVTASDFTTDPATITIPQASFSGGESEIYIVETSSGLQINPSDITEVGVNYQIEIDQCDLIEWDDLELGACIDYNAAFPAATWLKLADLTIYRRYLDTSTQGTITFGPSCNCFYLGEACAGSDYTGCVYVIDEQISKVRVSLADYDEDSESWTCSSAVPCGCYKGDKVAVHYYAGTTSVPGWEQAVYRLAHTYMVVEPCGCTMFDLSLQRDRNIPSVLTAERINCPLGTMDGAWYAWQWLQSNKHLRSFML